MKKLIAFLVFCTLLSGCAKVSDGCVKPPKPVVHDTIIPLTYNSSSRVVLPLPLSSQYSLYMPGYNALTLVTTPTFTISNYGSSPSGYGRQVLFYGLDGCYSDSAIFNVTAAPMPVPGSPTCGSSGSSYVTFQSNSLNFSGLSSSNNRIYGNDEYSDYSIEIDFAYGLTPAAGYRYDLNPGPGRNVSITLTNIFSGTATYTSTSGYVYVYVTSQSSSNYVQFCGVTLIDQSGTSYSLTGGVSF